MIINGKKTFSTNVEKKKESLERLLCLWATWEDVRKQKEDVMSEIDRATLKHNREFGTARMEDYK